MIGAPATAPATPWRSDAPVGPRLPAAVRKFALAAVKPDDLLLDGALRDQVVDGYRPLRADPVCAVGSLFQQFVRTFCKRETDYRVRAPKIDWFGSKGSETDLRHLPGMQTDIVLRSSERTIIVDTKFYKNPIDTRFGGERVRSANLHQIFAYVTNWAAAASADERVPEGWLVYAAVDGDFDYRFEPMGRQIRVCSIDLAQGWREIERDLRALVAL